MAYGLRTRNKKDNYIQPINHPQKIVTAPATPRSGTTSAVEVETKPESLPNIRPAVVDDFVLKLEDDNVPVKLEDNDGIEEPKTGVEGPEKKKTASRKRRAAGDNTKVSSKRAKKVPDGLNAKSRRIVQWLDGSYRPHPDHKIPTPEECYALANIFTKTYGESLRPDLTAARSTVAGCGEVRYVLDALLRTIMSLNTTAKNSGRAFQSLIARFGLIPADSKDYNPKTGLYKGKFKGIGPTSVDWDAVRRAPASELSEAIKVGGLQGGKTKAIKAILDRLWEEGKEEKRNARIAKAKQHKPYVEGEESDSELSDLDDDEESDLTLEYLHDMDDKAVWTKLTSYDNVGVKAAACVMLFCLKRQVFPVDTHVHRLCKFLGWAPQDATRDTTFFHLDPVIPYELKYQLHNHLIRHGRTCKACKGGVEKANTPKGLKKNDAASTKEMPTKGKNDTIMGEAIKEKSTSGDGDSPKEKSKRSRKTWLDNGLMKEVLVEVEVDTDDEAEEVDVCVIEHLVNRVRKQRAAPKSKLTKEEGEEYEDEERQLDEDELEQHSVISRNHWRGARRSRVVKKEVLA